MKLKLTVLLGWILVLKGYSACLVQSSKLLPETDALQKILHSQSGCPTNVQEFSEWLKNLNLKAKPTLVANRGFHNPKLGSFSFFETVTGQLDNVTLSEGEFFFGHFTAEENDNLFLDQSPDKGKLMIELIVWDFGKQVFNFYEMIGNGQEGKWFYRGDSLDILKDNQYLHRIPPSGTPKFGGTLRCSACHTSGGPILKELESPHNDWWSGKHPLPFGKNLPDLEVSSKLKALQETEHFSQKVKTGIQKLNQSEAYTQKIKSLSLQEKLRPIFCEAEINLESDSHTNEEKASQIKIPSSFFVNPLLNQKPITITRALYEKFLAKFQMQFPETSLADADHAWLTPVKGFSDLKAIQSLIEKGEVDSKWVTDVLSVDFKTPLLSKERCGLLKLLPSSETSDWQENFQENLKASNLPSAKTLLEHFASHASSQQTVEGYFSVVQSELAEEKTAEKYFLKLLETRKSVFQSEISKNPKGQILEPGFRLIFPVPTTL